MDEFRLITLDPGHFHAGLIQKEMYRGVAKRVAVYAPLTPDLTEHLNRIARFNLREESPTAWELDIHAVGLSSRRLNPPRGSWIFTRRRISWSGCCESAPATLWCCPDGIEPR